jgi:hypothetical protein
MVLAMIFGNQKHYCAYKGYKHMLALLCNMICDNHLIQKNEPRKLQEIISNVIKSSNMHTTLPKRYNIQYLEASSGNEWYASICICRMDLPGPTTSVGTKTDYSVGPWDYPTYAARHLMA